MFPSSSQAFQAIPMFFRSRKPTPECARLPQEMVDMVLDFLHNDKQALSTGSLVCQSWLTSARIHLFASLTLNKNTDFAGLAAMLDGSPQLADCIRIITIYGDLPFSLGSDSYEWLEEGLQVMSKLKKIRKINWWAFDWGVVENILSRSSYTFPPVSELCADGVRFSSVENLVLFFRTFSNVTSLTLRDIHVMGLDLSAMPLLFSHSPPRLQQLFLMSNGANGPLIDFLLLPHFEFDLRCLHTAWTPQLCLENHFQTLCGVVGPTVRELLIVVKCSPTEDLIKCLRSFTQLRHLTLTLEDPKINRVTLSDWLPSAFDELPSCLEQITLDFRTPAYSLVEFGTLDPDSWKSVDHKLSNMTQFPSLNNVSMQGFHHRPRSALAKPETQARQIADNFPGLTKRGSLRVFRGAEQSRVLLFP